MAYNSKISRLPRVIRDEINLRLDNGEQAATIMAWLNALPKVQSILARQFKGQPISKQNVSSWRKSGFRDWRLQAETVKAATELAVFIRQSLAAKPVNPVAEPPPGPALTPASAIVVSQSSFGENQDGSRLVKVFSTDERAIARQKNCLITM